MVMVLVATMWFIVFFYCPRSFVPFACFDAV